MGKVYKSQTDLTIRLQTGKNLTGISDVSIVTKNPNGIYRTFAANIADVVTGIIEYNIQSATDFDVAGSWILWAKVIDAGGLVSIGEPSTLKFNNQGEWQQKYNRK